LPGRADGYPSGPPTDPYVRHARIRFLKQSRCCPRKVSLTPQSTGLPCSGLVRAQALPCLLPAGARPDSAYPPVGRLGLPSPLAPVRCATTPATAPSRGASLVARFPETLPASVVRGVRCRLVTRWKPQVTPGPVVTRSPTPGLGSRRPVALPRSHVPPLETCPALRPRWCPAHAPQRTQDCGLPATGHRRLSPRYDLEGPPLDHHETLCGAPSRGLRPRSSRLRTAPDGEARGSAPDRQARRASGGIGASRARTYWETATHFMGLHPLPRFWASLGATSAMLCPSGAPYPAPPASSACLRPSPRPPCNGHQRVSRGVATTTGPCHPPITCHRIGCGMPSPWVKEMLNTPQAASI
jgi:hypothetical protein